MTKKKRFKHLGLFISYKKGEVMVMSRKYENDINYQKPINENR